MRCAAAYDRVPNRSRLRHVLVAACRSEVSGGRTQRAGLITTNSIRQKINRQVVAHGSERGRAVLWAVPTIHGSMKPVLADVTVAIDRHRQGSVGATRVTVDGDAQVTSIVRCQELHPDLSAHADVGTRQRGPSPGETEGCAPTASSSTETASDWAQTRLRAHRAGQGARHCHSPGCGTVGPPRRAQGA